MEIKLDDKVSLKSYLLIRSWNTYHKEDVKTVTKTFNAFVEVKIEMQEICCDNPLVNC